MNSAFTYTNVHNVVPFMSNHRRYSIHDGAGKTWTYSLDHIIVNRIDLQVEVLPVPLQDLATAPAGESSATIRERVIRARAVQSARFEGEKGIHCNAQMNTRLLSQYAQPTPEAMDYLMHAMTRLNLSARAYERVLKVARTIADLAASADITKLHIAEALSYRNLDRSTWGE